MSKWKPADCIALVVILIAGVLLYNSINHFVGWTLVGVTAAYFGIDLTPYIKVGRNFRIKKEDK